MDRAISMYSLATILPAPHAPEPLRGWGSPTILVDGVDVAGQLAPTATSCRLYANADGRLVGTPPEELVRELVAMFRARGVTDISELTVTREDVRFMLPKTIRSAGTAR